MPIKKNAAKALKQAKKRTVLNLERKKKVRDIKKKIADAIQNKNKEEVLKLLAIAYKAIDKAAKKHTIHKNKAARQKAQIAKKINSLK